MKRIDKLVCFYIAITSLIYIPFCLDIPITGDEVYYHSTAELFPQFIKQLLLLDFENARHTRSLIIGAGFIIPTTSLLLSPVTEFTSSLIIFRLYIFALNLGLTVYLLKQIDHLFAYRVALIFSVTSIFCPLYTIFPFTFWAGFSRAINRNIRTETFSLCKNGRYLTFAISNHRLDYVWCFVMQKRLSFNYRPNTRFVIYHKQSGSAFFEYYKLTFNSLHYSFNGPVTMEYSNKFTIRKFLSNDHHSRYESNLPLFRRQIQRRNATVHKCR